MVKMGGENGGLTPIFTKWWIGVSLEFALFEKR